MHIKIEETFYSFLFTVYCFPSREFVHGLPDKKRRPWSLRNATALFTWYNLIIETNSDSHRNG